MVKRLLPSLSAIVLSMCLLPGLAMAANDDALQFGSTSDLVMAVQGAPVDANQALSAQASNAVQKKANRLYYKKLKGYVRTYGKPKLVKDSGNSAATGVAYAAPVDFDKDGLSELLVAYYKKSAENKDRTWSTMPDARAYRVEVWGYQSGKVKVLHKFASEFSNGGHAYVRMFNGISEVGLGKRLLESGEYKSGNGSSTHTLKMRTVKNGKAKTAMTYKETGLYSSNYKSYINGKLTSMSTMNWLDEKLVEYDVVEIDLMDYSAGSKYGYPGEGVRKTSYVTPSKAVSKTKKTIEALANS